MTKLEKIKEEIEESIGGLYVGLYNLRSMKEYQEEYDTMSSLISMLQKDREYMRQEFDIEF